ncbi:unnamed protein product, partial [Brassica oleracea var. botrytis]
GTFCLLPPPPPPHRNPRNPISASRRSGSTRTHKPQQLRQHNHYLRTERFLLLQSQSRNPKHLNQRAHHRASSVSCHTKLCLSSSNFQTISNPLRTQAGDSAEGHFPLNITTSGNTVNITSGVTNTIRP